MAEDWLGGLAQAGWTVAFFGSIFMNGEPRRVYTQFNEMADADMLLEDRMRNMEVLAVLSVHCDAVDKLVVVGEFLVIEALLEVHLVHGYQHLNAQRLSGRSLNPFPQSFNHTTFLQIFERLSEEIDEMSFLVLHD